MSDPSQNPPNSVCPHCGVRFECGITAGKEQCWCFSLPPILPAEAGSSCLCPNCLRAEIRETDSVRERAK